MGMTSLGGCLLGNLPQVPFGRSLFLRALTPLRSASGFLPSVLGVPSSFAGTLVGLSHLFVTVYSRGASFVQRLLSSLFCEPRTDAGLIGSAVSFACFLTGGLRARQGVGDGAVQ